MIESSEKYLLNAILARFPKVAEKVKRRPKLANKVVRYALQQPATVVRLIELYGYTDRLLMAAFRCLAEIETLAETDEYAAIVASDLHRALLAVPEHLRQPLCTLDKRSSRVRAALRRVRLVLGGEE